MSKKRKIIFDSDMAEKYDLDSSELLVFIVLMSYFQTTGEFFGTYDYVREVTSLKRNTISNVYKRLIEKGLIKKEKYGKKVIYTFGDSVFLDDRIISPEKDQKTIEMLWDDYLKNRKNVKEKIYKNC